MFLDTSGLFGFHHKAELQHADAVRLIASESNHITHNGILAEFVALAAARKSPRPAVLDFVAELLDNPLTEVVYIDEALQQAALKLLRKRPDKNWSLVDAISFVIMEQRGVTTALTTDNHFEQAGFVRLLKP